MDFGVALMNLKISIHAPREGSDKLDPVQKILMRNFNPRSP